MLYDVVVFMTEDGYGRAKFFVEARNGHDAIEKARDIVRLKMFVAVCQADGADYVAYTDL